MSGERTDDGPNPPRAGIASESSSAGFEDAREGSSWAAGSDMPIPNRPTHAGAVATVEALGFS